MAAIVYNGLQPYLESQPIEPRILGLKLSSLPSSSSKPLNSQSIELAFKSCFWDPNNKEHGEDIITNKKSTSDSILDYNFGGFSSLQALSGTSQSLLGNKEPLEKESSTNTTTYVHPLMKRSSLVLSEKSLQLCTENLGNETGTDMTENCIDSLDSECGGKLATREQVKSVPRPRAKKAINMQNFPPPLTTIRGSESLRVRPHREEGRLVINAVKVPSSVTCFQAERSHGRLRLCFLKNTNPVFDFKDETEQEIEGTDEEYEEQIENDVDGQRQEVEETASAEEEDQEQEYFQDGDERDVYEGSEDTKGKKFNVGDDTGMEKYERPSRCKEGEHESNGLLNWEPYLVATS